MLIERSDVFGYTAGVGEIVRRDKGDFHKLGVLSLESITFYLRISAISKTQVLSALVHGAPDVLARQQYETAKHLAGTDAREHFDLEDGIERVIWFKNGAPEEIHVIEVNRNTIPEGAILTFYLRPTQEFPLPIILGDITPEEWEKVKQGLISLPEGWTLDNIEVFERSEILQPSQSL